MKNTPSFIIIGAAKSGTTSLADYLKQHPEICFSKMKEARYLAYQGNVPEYKGYGELGSSIMSSYDRSLPHSWDEYQELFAAVKPGQQTGEASPAYLYLPGVAEEIHRLLPDVKLIVILRNPVERAYSSYLHMRRENAEIEDFEQALALEDHRIAEGAGLPYHYKSMGFYGKQLAEYYRLFDRSRIKVLFYEELCQKPATLMAEVCDFLAINPAFEFDFTKISNVSGIPGNRKLYDLLKNPKKSRLLSCIAKYFPARKLRSLRSRVNRRMLKKPSLSPTIRTTLEETYSSDLALLEELTGHRHPWQ